MGQLDQVDRILEKENRHPTRQTRVLEEETRHQPPEKSVRSAAGRVRSAELGGSGLSVDWTALRMSV